MQISTVPEPIGNKAGGLKLRITPALPCLVLKMCLGSEPEGLERRMCWVGFHGGRHVTPILGVPGGLRAQGEGFGALGSFAGGVTEYSWDDLTSCTLNVIPASGPFFCAISAPSPLHFLHSRTAPSSFLLSGPALCCLLALCHRNSLSPSLCTVLVCAELTGCSVVSPDSPRGSPVSVGVVVRGRQGELGQSLG